MNVSIKSLVCGFAMVLAANAAFGQDISVGIAGGGNQVTYKGTGAVVPDSAVNGAGGDAALAGAVVFDLVLDSTADLLNIDAALTVTKGSLINYPSDPATSASDTAPPSPFALPNLQRLLADTWITTPSSATGAAGANLIDEMGTKVSHFDSSDDGAQTDFQWANITLMPDADGNASATLVGEIQTSGTPTPVFDDFTYTLTVGVPEPTSMGLMLTALLGGLSFIRRKRS